jgi:hypothetical protein
MINARSSAFAAILPTRTGEYAHETGNGEKIPTLTRSYSGKICSNGLEPWDRAHQPVGSGLAPGSEVDCIKHDTEQVSRNESQLRRS